MKSVSSKFYICIIVVVVVLTAAAAHAGSWSQGAFPRLSVDGPVNAAVEFNDSLYVAGSFSFVSGVKANSIARWDGQYWYPVGDGVNGDINALVVFDDGSGSDLYAVGKFTAAGGAAANNIAKWDGTSWSALGTGVDGDINAVAVHNDGTGNALYMCGSFANAGGAPARNIAKWGGSGWSALGTGLTFEGTALTSFGGELYAGSFTGYTGLQKWDGAAWTDLSSIMTGCVKSLVIFNDGYGPALYIGGALKITSGSVACGVAKWNGSAMSAVDSNLAKGVDCLCVYNDGSGNALYAGGSLIDKTGGITLGSFAKFNGITWQAVSPSPTRPISCFASYNDGTGNALYAGGWFNKAGGVETGSIAKWKNGNWSALGSGLNAEIYAFKYIDGNLWAGGECGIYTMNADGSFSLTHSCSKTLGQAYVSTFTDFSDGSGSKLYAAGLFDTVDGVSAGNIACWNGTSWTSVGAGFDESIEALQVFDGKLYAGGKFTTTGGVPASRIAVWDGTQWAPVGLGLDLDVYSLAVYDNGAGPALYAAGAFNMSGTTTTYYVAKWNGTAWVGVGNGFDDEVYALKVFNGTLYAAGKFTKSGTATVNRVARWTGTAWAQAGNGIDQYEVRALPVIDSQLYAIGGFVTSGETRAEGIAVLNGSTWQPVANGLSAGRGLYDIYNYTDSFGPAMLAGGSFRAAAPGVSVNIARWRDEMDSLDVTLSKSTSVGKAVALTGMVSTAVFGNAVYLEQPNRASGIKVVMPDGSFARDKLISVEGRMNIDTNDECYIEAYRATTTGQGSVGPLLMNNSALGGGASGLQRGTWSLRSIYDQAAGKYKLEWGEMYGLNNIGLLVRTFGKVKESTGNTFVIDDGSNMNIKCVLQDGQSIDPAWTHVTLTGVVSCEVAGQELHTVIKICSIDDVQPAVTAE